MLGDSRPRAFRWSIPALAHFSHLSIICRVDQRIVHPCIFTNVISPARIDSYRAYEKNITTIDTVTSPKPPFSGFTMRNLTASICLGDMQRRPLSRRSSTQTSGADAIQHPPDLQPYADSADQQAGSLPRRSLRQTRSVQSHGFGQGPAGPGSHRTRRVDRPAEAGQTVVEVTSFPRWARVR